MRIQHNDSIKTFDIQKVASGIRVKANFARTGVQQYLASELSPLFDDRAPNSIINVYRPADEVFRPESIASYHFSPATDNHPAGFVDESNSREHTRGITLSAAPNSDGIHISGEMFIFDGDLIKAIDGGKKELSAGYSCDYAKETTVCDGVTCEATQRDITINHIAFVNRARCGATCSVTDNAPELNQNKQMKKITIDGKPIEVDDAVGTHFETLEKAVTDAKGETVKVQGDWDRCKAAKDAEVAGLRTQIDTVTAERDAAKAGQVSGDEIARMADERAEVITKAVALVGDAGFDRKAGTLEIMRKVCADKCPDLKDTSAGKSKDYIQARFDALQVSGRAGDALTPDGGGTQDRDLVADAKAKREADDREAHKK